MTFYKSGPGASAAKATLGQIIASGVGSCVMPHASQGKPFFYSWTGKLQVQSFMGHDWCSSFCLDTMSTGQDEEDYGSRTHQV